MIQNILKTMFLLNRNCFSKNLQITFVRVKLKIQSNEITTTYLLYCNINNHNYIFIGVGISLIFLY